MGWPRGDPADWLDPVMPSKDARCPKGSALLPSHAETTVQCSGAVFDLLLSGSLEMNKHALPTPPRLL